MVDADCVASQNGPTTNAGSRDLARTVDVAIATTDSALRVIGGPWKSRMLVSIVGGRKMGRRISKARGLSEGVEIAVISGAGPGESGHEKSRRNGGTVG